MHKRNQCLALLLAVALVFGCLPMFNGVNAVALDDYGDSMIVAANGLEDSTAVSEGETLPAKWTGSYKPNGDWLKNNATDPTTVGAAQVVKDSDLAHSGEYCIKIEPKKAGSRAYVYYEPDQSVLVKGATYRISVWAKVVPADGYEVKNAYTLRVLPYNLESGNKGPNPALSSEWQLFSFEVNMENASRDGFRVLFGNNQKSQTGSEPNYTLYLDDVTVERVYRGTLTMENNVSIAVGEKTTLHPVQTPASTAKVTFTSADESIAKVNPTTGEVEAVSAGTTTITATVDGSACNNVFASNDTSAIPARTATTTVNVPAGVAQIGDVPYPTVDAALDAAKSGDVVYLTANATAGNVVIPRGVTLNLGKYTLTADSVDGLRGSKLTAAVNSGKLVVPTADDLWLPEDGYATVGGFPVLPIWTGAGYVFDRFATTFEANDGSRGVFLEDNTLRVQFATVGETDAIYNSYLKDSASNAGLKVVLCMSWDLENAAANQEFVFTDNMVKYAISNDQVEGKFWDFTVSLPGASYVGIDSVDALNGITAQIELDCGIIYSVTN